MERSIKCLKKVRPGLMTLQAKDKNPIKERRSRFTHVFFTVHPSRRALSLDNFSSGNLIVKDTVSIKIPKYVIEVAGPTTLSKARGTPKSRQVSVAVPK